MTPPRQSGDALALESRPVAAPNERIALGRGNSLSDRLHERMFRALYRRALVYNTCWEDPAVDRQALELRPQHTVLVITSAGCNALDYVLAGAGRVVAVDANPRQSALLELKLAGIRALGFDDFFFVFGRGRHPRFAELYRTRLRPLLSPYAQKYWDRHRQWFAHSGPGQSFYSHGLAGQVGRVLRGYLKLNRPLDAAIDELLGASTLDSQRRIYDELVSPALWKMPVNWALSTRLTMSALGVPPAQRQEVEREHEGGVVGYVRRSLDYVFRELPLEHNYFWQLYLRGHYTRECCPEYLKAHNFERLRAGAVDRIEVHTALVTDWLEAGDSPVDRFVLLDHMDWLSASEPAALAAEWQAILRRAAPGARAIFRSAHRDPAFLDATLLELRGARMSLRDAMRWHPALAERLTREDRVHTYAGFHIADLPVLA